MSAHFVAGFLAASLLWGAILLRQQRVHWSQIRALVDDLLHQNRSRFVEPIAIDWHGAEEDDPEDPFSRVTEPDPVEPAPYRLLVHLLDWGPDFTGEEGTLHRWRWTIWDGDKDPAEIGLLVPGPPQVGYDVPYFLGNAPDPDEAYRQARQWAADAYPDVEVEHRLVATTEHYLPAPGEGLVQVAP